MGVIEDGSIKGRLPSTEAFAVHYPAYPSSLSRAVETLGGLDAISKVRCSNLNKLEHKLELRFRPEDPFSHPAFGQLRPCNNLLLRISKSNSDVNRSNNCSSSQSVDCSSAQTESSSVLSADIVALVPEAYRFNGMVDYQHVLAVHANAGQGKEKRCAEVKGPFEKGDIGDVDDEDLMIMVPPLFALKDVPENIVLRPSITLSSKKKQEGVVHHRWEMEIEPCLAIDFSIQEIPQQVIWEQYIPKGSDHWKLQMAVSKLFDERPIWPRSSIHERLGNMGLKLGDHTLKRLLFRSAYYFGSGPFHRFWIRKGYDPRKDPESRIYQRIDFRVPPPLRGYCDTGSGKKHRWEDMCAFRVFPYKCQTYLQLSELGDNYIQDEICRTPTQTVCSCSTGWFSSYALDNLRLRVALRFLSVYPQGGAESLLKSVSERFEKSKKTRFQVNLKPGEVGESQASQEPNGEGDKADVDDDEEEEEEENEIEVEDEMDMDDPAYMVEEDADFSLQTDSYLGAENISKNFLQELFGSFPSTGGVSSQSHAAETEAEYQIYEHDSDGNYSDDDF